MVETGQVGEESQVESTQTEDGHNDSKKEEPKDEARKVEESTPKEEEANVGSSSRPRRPSILGFFEGLSKPPKIQTDDVRGTIPDDEKPCVENIKEV